MQMEVSNDQEGRGSDEKESLCWSADEWMALCRRLKQRKHFLLPKQTMLRVSGDADRRRTRAKCSPTIIEIRWTHFDWPLQLGLLVPQPHHADDGQGDAEPVEEAEEVDDGENVVGEGVEQRHQTLEGRQKRMVNKQKHPPTGEFRIGGGVPTVKIREGSGVSRVGWIIDSRLGRWPSRAPTKNNLRAVKTGVSSQESVRLAGAGVHRNGRVTWRRWRGSRSPTQSRTGPRRPGWSTPWDPGGGFQSPAGNTKMTERFHVFGRKT